MSGEQLLKHLQLLGVPGTEQLVGETYDWLFLKTKDDPLATFLQWFMENITPNNVLTEEELSEYVLGCTIVISVCVCVFYC